MHVGEPATIEFTTQPSIKAYGIGVKALQHNQQKRVLLETAMYDAGGNVCNNPDVPLTVGLSIKEAPEISRQQVGVQFSTVTTTSGLADFTQHLDVFVEQGRLCCTVCRLMA